MIILKNDITEILNLVFILHGKMFTNYKILVKYYNCLIIDQTYYHGPVIFSTQS